jgi:hypothetical protein
MALARTERYRPDMDRIGTGYGIPGLYIISGHSTHILMKHIAKTSIL